MTQDENARLVRRYFVKAWTAGNLSLVDELGSPEYVGHSPFGDFRGTEKERERLTYIHETFPGFQHTIEDEIVAEDKVVLRFFGMWPLQGEWMGIQGGGKQMTGTGIIDRVENGSIAESWLKEDLLGAIHQLGAQVVSSEPLETAQDDGRSSD